MERSEEESKHNDGIEDLMSKHEVSDEDDNPNR
jgi:hypothetical protein